MTDKPPPPPGGDDSSDARLYGSPSYSSPSNGDPSNSGPAYEGRPDDQTGSDRPDSEQPSSDRPGSDRPDSGRSPGGDPYGGGPSGGRPPFGAPPSGGDDPSGGGPPPHGYDPAGGFGEPDPRPGEVPALGGSGRRLAARILDAIIVIIPVGIVVSASSIVDWTNDTRHGSHFGSDFGASVLYAVSYFVYEGLMLSRRGQTLGKRAMSIRVAMVDDGSLPNSNAAWTRSGVYHIPGIVPCLGTVFWLVNVLWHLWDRPNRQCLHDKAAKTVVISTD